MRLLTGRGQYAGDVRVAGALHAVVGRSPHAHARLRRVETSKARALRGVVALFTARDLGPVGRIPVRVGPNPSVSACLQPPLAAERMRYVGEPFVVVVAADRYVAEDALELVEAEFEPLPAATSIAQALGTGAPRVHEGLVSNVVDRFEERVGDAEAALAQATVRLRETFSVQRHTAVPMETRGLAAVPDPGTGVLTVWGPTKAVHFTRRVLADLLGYPEHLITIRRVDVGGGFGVRGEFYPEDFLIPWVAMRLGRPVQWVEDRREHFVATNHSRQQEHDVEVGVRSDGTIVALVDRIDVDLGAYVRTNGLVPPKLAAAMLPGPYRIPNFLCEVACVLTHKTPCGTYRGPGRYEGTFVRERVVDLVAHQLGLDPAEVRRRNFVEPEAMPYHVGTGAFEQSTVYDSGDYPSAFETALAAVDYKGVRAEQDGARGRGRYIGVGLGSVVEKAGLGPWESARVEVDGSGAVAIYAGVSSLGEGLETALTQVCAEVLGVPPGSVNVIFGDTSAVPLAVGGGASRGAVMAGNAVLEASRGLRTKMVRLAAALLEAHEEDLVLDGDRVHVRGLPDRALTFRDLARAALPGQGLPAGMEPGLAATAFFEAPKMVYPYGTHAAVVEVDPGTGRVRVLKYAIAWDVGRAINPMIVEGQLLGGLAQGLGGALLEELAYDDAGQLLTTTFMDYLLPTAEEMPETTVARVLEEAPSPLNPLGVKGAGEGGSSGVGAAIANAVADALAPLGVRVTALPLTPDRILDAIRSRRHP